MNKKNLILLGIFAVLTLAAYLVQGPIKSVGDKLSSPKNFLDDLEVDAISAIDIRSGGEDLTLEKSGDRWLIAGTRDFYATAETMTAGLAGLKAAAEARLDLASENAANKDDFRTSTSSGTVLALRQGERVLAEFIIGKNGSDFNSTYISQLDAPETYSAPVNLRQQWARGDWYDLTVLDLDKDKIDYLRLQFPGREFTLQKGEDGWSGILPYSFQVSEEKINDILSRVAPLRAVSVPAQTFAGTGLEKNLLIMQAKGEGFDQTLMIGDKDEDGNYFAKRGDSDNIYLVSESVKTALDKQIRDLN